MKSIQKTPSRPDQFWVTPELREKLIFGWFGGGRGSLVGRDIGKSRGTGTFTSMTASAWQPTSLGRWGVYNASASGYMNFGDLAAAKIEYTQPFTFSAWIYRAGSPTVNAIINKGGVGTGMEFICYTADALAFAINNSTYRWSANSIIPLNSWVHVAATWDGGSSYTGIRLYLNGVETGYRGGGGTVSATMISTKPLLVGARESNSWPFQGGLADVLMLRGAASPALLRRIGSKDPMLDGLLEPIVRRFRGWTPPAPPVGGFQSAWALGVNTYIGVGA